MSNEKKEKLELELIKLSQLDKHRSDSLSEIKQLQTELLNSRISEVGFKEVLQENVEVFTTQNNKNKLRKFLMQYPVIKVDMAYTKTSTYCLQVAMDKTKSFSEQYEQIVPFLAYLVEVPSIIECPLKITGRHIKIKEYRLGDEGLIELVIPSGKNEIWITRTRHRVATIVKKFAKMEDAFKYIHEQHPFYI